MTLCSSRNFASAFSSLGRLGLCLLALGVMASALRVTGDGFTVIDPQERPVNLAAQWKNLGTYENFLASRLAAKP